MKEKHELTITEEEAAVLEKVRARFKEGTEDSEDAEKALLAMGLTVDSEGEYFTMGHSSDKSIEWVCHWEVGEIEVWNGREPFLSEVRAIERLQSSVVRAWESVGRILEKGMPDVDWDLEVEGYFGSGDGVRWDVGWCSDDRPLSKWVYKEKVVE